MKKLVERIKAYSLKDRQSIVYFLLGVGAILLVLGYYSYGVLLALGIFVLALMLLFSLLAFRCPDCDAYLGERMMGYSHCPKCGKKLEE